MQPIVILMHALSTPDDYIFDWRNGELCIEPKTPTDTYAAADSDTTAYQAIPQSQSNVIHAHA